MHCLRLQVHRLSNYVYGVQIIRRRPICCNPVGVKGNINLYLSQDLDYVANWMRDSMMYLYIRTYTRAHYTNCDVATSAATTSTTILATAERKCKWHTSELHVQIALTMAYCLMFCMWNEVFVGVRTPRAHHHYFIRGMVMLLGAELVTDSCCSP